MIKLSAVGQIQECLIGLDPTDPAVTAVNCDRIASRFDVCVITAVFRSRTTDITNVFDLDSVPDLWELADVTLLDNGTSAGAHHRQIHHQSQALNISDPGGRAVVSPAEVLGVLQPLSTSCPKPPTRGQHLLRLLHLTDQGGLLLSELP